MRSNQAKKTGALALAAAALPTLAFASGSQSSNPQQEARIERLIEQAIQGNSDVEAQEQARIERLVQQALQRAATPAGRSIEGGGHGGRPSVVAEGRPGPIGR